MLLKYFRSNYLSLFFVIPFLVILAWVPSFSAPADTGALTLATGIFGNFFLSVNNDFPFISDIIALTIITVNGFILVGLNTQHFFIPVRTFLPALFYMLISAAVPSLNMLTPALVSSFFFIIFLFRVLGTFRKEGLSYAFFDAGILLSLASFFYLPAVLFYPLLLTAMIILRPYIWRELAFTVTGLILPYIFLFAFFYINDLNISSPLNNIMESLQSSGKVDFNIWFTLFVSYIALLIAVASVYMFRTIGNLKIHSRKFFIIFLWIFIFSVLIFFFVPAAGAEMVYFLAIPVTYLISNYFMHCRKKWTNGLLLLIFLLSVFASKYI